MVENAMLERLQKFTDLIKDELNVKELAFTSQKRDLVNYEILPLPHVLGKTYGKLFPKLCATLAKMDTDALIQSLEKDQRIEIEVDNRVITLLPEEIEVRTRPEEGYILAEEQGIVVGLYAVVTEELKKEGLAREIVRRVQNQRKDAGFDIADQIEIYYKTGPRLSEVFITHGVFIASETLSISMHKAEPPEGAHVANYKIEGESLRIGLIRTNHA